jgi:UDP:flavonoid glycosyltransferase YjiC (YdhE family)
MSRTSTGYSASLGRCPKICAAAIISRVSSARKSIIVYVLCDLVIGRAGAGTINEVCALGLPAIYIPLVPTRGDEQTRNAEVCARAGAAEIIPQSELNGQRLLDAAKLLMQPTRLDAMGAAARALARPYAARDMAQAVIALAQEKINWDERDERDREM